MATDDAQRRRDLGGTQGLAQWIADAKGAQQAEAAQERAAIEATPQGKLAAIQSRQRVLGATFSQAQWDEMHDQNGWPREPKPTDDDLTLEERNAAQQERLAAIFKERTR